MRSKPSSNKSQQISFRRMTKDDLDAVINIELSAYTHPWTTGIFLDCLRVGYACWVIINESEQVVGYSVLSYAVGEAHVLNICVSPECQGRGIGRQAMLFQISMAQELGASTLLLEVRPSNKHAVCLYEDLGFNEVGVRRNYYDSADGREDALIMALTIFSDAQTE